MHYMKIHSRSFSIDILRLTVKVLCPPDGQNEFIGIKGGIFALLFLLEFRSGVVFVAPL